MAAAFLLLTGPAWAIGPGQADESREVIITAVAFLVITVGTSVAAVLLGRRNGRGPSILRAILGALIGFVLTAALSLALMADSRRDAAFVATSVFTLGAIPTGLIGLIVGGLSTVLERYPSQR